MKRISLSSGVQLIKYNELVRLVPRVTAEAAHFQRMTATTTFKQQHFSDFKCVIAPHREAINRCGRTCFYNEHFCEVLDIVFEYARSYF